MDLLLTPAEFRVLDGLRLRPQRTHAGRIRGERLTRQKGISTDFADFRDYTDGDDLRHLDWNVLARLGTAVVRTYQDEEDLAVHLLLDRSPSMRFGTPAKLDAATKLAAVLAYVGLVGGDAIYPALLGATASRPRALRGHSSYPALARALASGSEPSKESLSASVRRFSSSGARRGVVALVSDGLDPDLPRALKAVAARGQEVWFLQILSPEDLDPDLEGDLRLVDEEGGTAVEITANSSVLRAYRDRLATHNAALSEVVRRSGGRYALVRSVTAVNAVVRDVFKRQGWIA